jgi:hypothetical protein
LQDVQAQHAHFLLVAAVGGDVAGLAVEDFGVGAVPALGDVEPGVEFPLQVTLTPRALRALAHVQGTIARRVPEVLFTCVHNAGHSQMAAALLDRCANGRVHAQSVVLGCLVGLVVNSGNTGPGIRRLWQA